MRISLNMSLIKGSIIALDVHRVWLPRDANIIYMRWSSACPNCGGIRIGMVHNEKKATMGSNLQSMEVLRRSLSEILMDSRDPFDGGLLLKRAPPRPVPLDSARCQMSRLRHHTSQEYS
jgi:hypothetical protein